ncbi:ATP-grasp domain-containing protein [Kitasatospora acidiphila]|uniref:ATP-grasp domain-containing protein n=2 Tax=Kitasatospora acidiphila TaxID=2567942 RepID=A0A540VXE5_9ACTN|nr:ATP-grasp domain-containing protein [Kitasatospora acidiphila]
MITGSDEATDRPLLLLVASGMRPYREYLLKSIATRFRVHLFHTIEPSWEKAYLSGWTVLADTCDGAAMAKAALDLHAATPVAGVLCWDEVRIHATAYVAEALGLLGGDPAVVWRLRDKGQTRAALAAAGVPQPASIPVSTEQEALAAAEELGYPVVLKPRGFGASLGVIRVEDAAALSAGFAFTTSIVIPEPVLFNSAEPYLVEECVTGEEISVDAVIRSGVVTPLFIGRKVVGYPPYAEEIGHFVDADDPLLTDPALVAALQDAHTALGVENAWTHTEFMLTADGPKLIEVNGRLGGDLIPYLGLLATGIDPGLAAASVACGLEPDLTPSRHRISGVRFFYVAEEDTTLGSVAFEGELPAAVDQSVVVAAPGAVVSPPPKGTVWGRIAFATATADSVDSCRQALDEAGGALVVNSV